MERKRTISKELPKKPIDGAMIQVLSELTNRAIFASKLGVQFDGVRDVYKALGYKTTLDFDDYFARYTRQEIAKAIIDRPVKVTWQGPLYLVESNEPEDTAFENTWKALDRKVGMKTVFTRVDRLTGIGRYGVLLLGLDDVSSNEGFAKPVAPGKRKLLYMKPFSEKNAPILRYADKPSDPRYGMPLFYGLQITDPASKSSSTVNVHYSRIIHIVDGNLESEIFGTPRLESVFNRLMDIEKIVGGDAEMFWRSARPGFKGNVKDDYTMTTKAKDALLNQLDEYEHDLRRFLVNEGVDVEALEQTIADPKSHFDVQIACICAEKGIPIRVLMGSERGELASSQDTTEWLSFVQSRREDFAEPHIVRPTVDRLIKYGILPNPGEDYTVAWQDLFSISEKSRVEIGKGRANALREYTYSPMAQAVLPPDAFLEICLGLTQEQITLVDAMRNKQMNDESDELMDIVKSMLDKEANPPTPAIPAGRPKPSTNKLNKKLTPKMIRVRKEINANARINIE